jgi:hypothetical protein
MSFTFDITIPAAPNSPSVDQPKMLQNNISANGILAADHITFNAPNGGMHTQMHMTQFVNPSAVSNGASDGSVIYPAAGIADPTRAQIYYKNAFQVQLPISPIKALGTFDGAGTLLNGINLTVSSHTSLTGLYVFAIPVNIITTNNYLVHINSVTDPNFVIVGSYEIISPTQFNVQFKGDIVGVIDPNQFSVTVLQI